MPASPRAAVPESLRDTGPRRLCFPEHGAVKVSAAGNRPKATPIELHDACQQNQLSFVHLSMHACCADAGTSPVGMPGEDDAGKLLLTEDVLLRAKGGAPSSC